MSAGQEMLQLDEAARARALEPRSFIVEAPAGAGKTELLTQRYLRLLASVNEPEEIIAITFTNKAAAEMRARILDSLNMVDDGALPAHKATTFSLATAVRARDTARGWDILANPGRLRITTIDALCANIARQMPFMSRFGAQPAVAEDAEPHYLAAAQAALDLLEAPDEDAAIVADALRYFDNDVARLRKLLVSMLARRDQWMSHVNAMQWQDATSGWSQLIAGDLARVGSVVGVNLQQQLMPAARYAAGILRDARSDSAICNLVAWAQPLSGNLDELDLWRGIAVLLLTGTGSLRKRFDKSVGLPPGPEGKTFKATLEHLCDSLRAQPGAEAALRRIQQIPGAALDPEEARIVSRFAALLKLAVAQLWTVFQQKREVDFSEISTRALLALGSADEPTDLQFRLDYQISHLLVDEFQDTSPSQIDLLEKLIAGWTPGDGRTLFVVGDPMQSIYRFRKADVGLFLQARQTGIGGIRLEPLRLNRNNRSHPEVVAWINQAFTDVFPPADNPQLGAVRFAPSVATKAASDGAGVFVHPILTLPDSTDGEVREAAEIIAIIRAAHQENPRQTVVVLARARSHLETLATEMRRRAPDLHYQAVEIDKLGGRQVVQDLLSLTLAMHHRGDRLNWLAVLRAPWCGLRLADLHRLAADDQRSTIWQLINDQARVDGLSSDGRRRLLHLRAVCAEAYAHQGRQRPCRWIAATWRMLGGESCLRSSSDSLDAQAYFRLMDELDERGNFSLQRLRGEVDSLFAAPDPVAGEIQMMTIHKSKGLEFDVVILPGLHRVARGNDSHLLLWEEFVDADGQEHLVAAPYRKRRGDPGQVTAYDYLRTIDTGRSANEDGRILYVAATRAVRALHLVGAAVVENGGLGPALKTPRAGCALAALWSFAETEFTAQLGTLAAPVASEISDASTFIPRLLRLSDAALESGGNRFSAPIGELPVSAATTPMEDNADESHGLALPADIGTLAHRMLEIVAQDGAAQWSVQRIQDAEPGFRRWLENRGHDAAALDGAARKVREILSRAVFSAPGQWLLARHDDEANELALTSQRDGRTQAHVIDRTFVADGERWIIDYKSSEFATDAPPELLRQRAEFWRPQLQRYAELFADEGLPIHMAIYFLAHGCLAELPFAKS